MPTIAQNTYEDVMVRAPYLRAEKFLTLAWRLHVLASGTHKRVRHAAPNYK